MLGVVNLKVEIVPGERPVQRLGCKAVERDAGRCNLALQLLEGLVGNGVLEGIPLDVQFLVFLHQQEDVLVVLPHQLNQMRERTVAAALIDSQEPDEHIHVAPGRQREKVVPFRVLAVGVLHDDLGDFRSINGVLQIARMDGIEAV